MTPWQWLTLAALLVAGCIFAWFLLRDVGRMLDELDGYEQETFK